MATLAGLTTSPVLYNTAHLATGKIIVFPAQKKGL
jgi:hypothetical protein